MDEIDQMIIHLENPQASQFNLWKTARYNHGRVEKEHEETKQCDSVQRKQTQSQLVLIVNSHPTVFVRLIFAWAGFSICSTST